MLSVSGGSGRFIACGRPRGVRLDLCPWCTKTLAECVCHYVERRPRAAARGVYALARGRVTW